MKIVILGAGAMGMLFGSYLSLKNDVLLLDTDAERVKKINADGIRVREGEDNRCFPAKAYLPSDCSLTEKADLVIVFVKAFYERAALEGAKKLIGRDTYLLTLQNGEGHEAVLRDYAEADRIIIGTTQDNSSIIENGYINHGGAGKTYIGLTSGNSDAIEFIAKNFTECGFITETAQNIKRLIWNKLFLNASASALTALFRCNLGFIVDNEYAWSLAEKLIAEAVMTANADGQDFDVCTVTDEIKHHLERSRGGYTSIYADITSGRKSEVDTISGAVVKAAKRLNLAIPNMEFIVNAIHAMENQG